MTKTEMKDFTTELLGGEELGDDLFDDLLKKAKDEGAISEQEYNEMTPISGF